MQSASTLNLNKTERTVASIDGQLGSLSVRLAQVQNEVRQAQRLRYRVFCEELSAKPDIVSRMFRRDIDRYDAQFDHLLINDISSPSNQKLVGTQRFQVQTGDCPASAFYSNNEFNIKPLLARHPKLRFMELGRSCILPEYRDKRTMELLWHGTWDYALQMQVDVMFGCASFQALTVEEIAPQLALLSQTPQASGEWAVTPRNCNAVELKSLQKKFPVDRKASRKLPPLIKGYLRLGAMFSTHAVKDSRFGTFDVLVVLPVENINPRYISHYGSNADRHRS